MTTKDSGVEETCGRGRDGLGKERETRQDPCVRTVQARESWLLDLPGTVETNSQ